MNYAQITTHVLDAVAGQPATGVRVELHSESPAGWVAVDSRLTDADGRIQGFDAELPPGNYRLRFATGAYFDQLGIDSFYPEIQVVFRVTEVRHYHVPILVSPFAYSTYRGS